jgi:tetratricopeptide (TPR) repeat protein
MIAALAGCATRRRWAALALVLLAIGGVWRSPSALRAETPRFEAGRVAADTRYLIIPFDNTQREARLYWLSEGSAVALTDDLLALGASAITREDRLRAFDSLNVPPVATLSHATVIRLGQLVGASHVVIGRFEQTDGTLHVRARAIRLDAGRMLPEVIAHGPLSQLLHIYAGVARQLVGAAGTTVEQIEQGQPPLAAFEQYIKGVLAESPATKIGYLQEALEIHPRFQRARLSQWDVYTEQGEHKRALDVARAVPDYHPLTRRARFLAATSLINLQQYDEAFAALTDLNRQKADPAILNNIGIVQLRRKATLPRAAYYFSEASKLDPDDPDLFFNLGYAYFIDGNPIDASHSLREAVRRNPADDEAHYALGVALQAAGSDAEATREKELARQLSSHWADREKASPGSAMPLELERVKSELVEPGALRVESVIVAAEQREQQELASFHLERGRRMFEQERDVEAIAELRRAIYLMPYHPEAHYLLARAYERGGRTREAIDSLKIAVWIDPKNRPARELLQKLSGPPR